MADLFTLSGSYGTTPAVGAPSGIASIPVPLDESMTLLRKQLTEPSLDVDTPVVVAFGGVVNAHVVVVKTTGKVKARFTSADGAQQALPIDSFFAMMATATPVTAIDLTRVPGVPTTAEVFLGERA